MINLSSSKGKKVASAIIVGILVAAMEMTIAGLCCWIVSLQ